MLNYSKFCLIMLCTRSTYPSAQQARTSACFAEIHKLIQAFKHCRGACASQDGSLKGKRKGRELQALEITLFQYRKGEGEGERERGVREREMRMRGSLGEVLTKGRNFVEAGHRLLTRIATRRHGQTPYSDLFRPPTYSWKSEHWKKVSKCFTKICFCKLLMPCVVRSTAAKSCLQGKMLTLC